MVQYRRKQEDRDGVIRDVMGRLEWCSTGNKRIIRNGCSQCAEVLENNWENVEFLWVLYKGQSNFWPDCKITVLLPAQTPTTLWG